jgi:1,4-alpha-glucan branching enzyme
MEEKIMSITKKFFPEKGICRVEFILPELSTNHAKTVSVVGDFNGWNPDINIMKKDRSKHFKCSIEFPIGKVFEFRYLIDRYRWENEWEADAYAPTPYEGEYNMILSCEIPAHSEK